MRCLTGLPLTGSVASKYIVFTLPAKLTLSVLIKVCVPMLSIRTPAYRFLTLL